MELEEFIELLFYGSSFASYDGGINIDAVLPEVHKIIYRAKKNNGVDGYR